MTMQDPITGYARLSPWQARGAIALALLFLCAGMIALPKPPELCHIEDQAKQGDVHLYLTEVERMHAGENYYQVASQELVAQGYPTRSVFNWRTPLPMWIVAMMPTIMGGRMVLIAAGILVVLLAFEAAAREVKNGYRFALPLAAMLTAPLLPCFKGDAFVLTEVWSGIAIALSIAAYGVDLWLLGLSIGLTSLFLRELALPYCLICMALAAWKGRRVETLAWAVGLAAWAGYFALHYWKVQQFITPDAIAHKQSWIQFGGLAFVIGTVQMNVCLVLLPVSATVVYLTLAMFGLAGWSSDWGRRVTFTTCMYIVAFSIVGQDFNRYWGLLTAPLFCFGIVRAPASIVEAMHAAQLEPWIAMVYDGAIRLVRSRQQRTA